MYQKHPITFDILGLSKELRGVFLYNVKLPDIAWFRWGNVFTGSLRANLNKGLLEQTTFNYRVQIVRNKNDTNLVAVCYYTLPIKAAANMDEAVMGRFSPNEFGITVCENWIKSKFIASSLPALKENAQQSLCTKNSTLDLVV